MQVSAKTKLACYDVGDADARAGLTIVPFMPWHRAPRCKGAYF